MKQGAAPRPGARLYKGAEATLTVVSHLGRLAVEKRREPKGYRIAPIEAAVSKARMRNEARLIRRARKAGVAVPAVLTVDPEAQALVLEYLGPESLRSAYGGLPAKRRIRVAEQIGRSIGSLHKASLIHGDLTTSNMMAAGPRVYFLDFSLGKVSDLREERAVDLKAFKDAFEATHLEQAGEFAHVLKGYRRVMGAEAERVMRTVRDIERRRRYA
jgi:Kae1-associated kinase Bud32